MHWAFKRTPLGDFRAEAVAILLLAPTLGTVSDALSQDYRRTVTLRASTPLAEFARVMPCIISGCSVCCVFKTKTNIKNLADVRYGTSVIIGVFRETVNKAGVQNLGVLR